MAAVTGRRSSQQGRRRPWWQTGLLHLILSVLSAVFLVPLFWLIGSSLKTDDQIKAFPPEWLPNLPYYSTASPYVDAYQYGRVRRPEGCSPATWGVIRDRLPAEAQRAAAAVTAKTPNLTARERAVVERGTLIEALAGLPAKTFAGSPEAVLAAVRAALPAAATKARAKATRTLALGAVSFQGEGAGREASHTFDTLRWDPLANAARPAREQQTTVDGQKGVVIPYEQRGGERLCTRVQAGLPWSSALDQFRNLTLKLHGDRSWRFLAVTLETPQGTYRTAQPILLSSSSWTDVILIRQPKGGLPWGTFRLVSHRREPAAMPAGEALLEIEVLGASRAQVVFRKLWNNYPSGLTFIPFARYLLNTLLISVLVVLGTILSCALVAYGLARVEWHGRHALFYLILGTMMLPFQVTMVPMFVVFARLGWVDSFLPLIVPAFFGNAFFIFLLRQFFLTIPPELTDAARIDGCSELDIFRRVVLPLAKPALATVGLFAFMNTWNDYVGPLIYLSDANKYTLSLGLASFSSQYGSYPGMLMAVTAVMTIPIIILFFLAQRTFIQGITLTGIKG